MQDTKQMAQYFKVYYIIYYSGLLTKICGNVIFLHCNMQNAFLDFIHN